MKTITFKAEDSIFDMAQRTAAAEHTTLSAEFGKWLKTYAHKRVQAKTTETEAQRREQAAQAMECVERISKTIDFGGRKFTREEMNER